ncbi:MAG TPA: AraC family ligand binding domain-containing protein [Pirellulales bacterium]|nr:AraC family ligand binding domain-containing protein [Pirellulales bacterium]
MNRSEQFFDDVDRSHRLSPGELPSFISKQIIKARRFYFDLGTKTSLPMKVVLGGSERVRADYIILRTMFPYYSIEFVAEGKGTLELRGKRYNLIPGTVFGYVPNSSLAIQADPRQLMLKYYITFIGKHAKKLLESIGFAPAGITQISHVTDIRDLYELMIHYGLNWTSYSQSLCDSVLNTLALKIAEQTIKHPSDDLRALATYQKIKDLIEEDFANLKNIKDVASRCKVSVSHACRLFQNYDHVSPYQFLMQKK